MQSIYASIRFPALALFAIVGMVTFSTTGVAADDGQAERETRRIEAEARREQEMVRRDTENRERAQAEVVRGQEEAIRRMEATRLRIEDNIQRIDQQAVDQARLNNYLYVTPGVALPPVPLPSPAPLLLPAIPVAPPVARNNEPVSGMSFAPLSEGLGIYFGVQSGVLVVSAGAGAPFGLQDGDVILSIDGRVPVDDQHAAAILRSYRPGERVKLQVQRGRKAINLDAIVPGLRGN